MEILIFKGWATMLSMLTTSTPDLFERSFFRFSASFLQNFCVLRVWFYIVSENFGVSKVVTTFGAVAAVTTFRV